VREERALAHEEWNQLLRDRFGVILE